MTFTDFIINREETILVQYHKIVSSLFILNMTNGSITDFIDLDEYIVESVIWRHLDGKLTSDFRFRGSFVHSSFPSMADAYRFRWLPERWISREPPQDFDTQRWYHSVVAFPHVLVQEGSLSYLFTFTLDHAHVASEALC